MKKQLFIVAIVVYSCLTGSYAQNPIFQWAKQLSGGLDKIGYSIAEDGAGNVYTTGFFQDITDFNPGVGTFTLLANGKDIFISKLDVNGNFVWAKQLGGALNDMGTSIAIDASGNVYTTGRFQGTADFDPSAGSFTLASFAGSEDIFISKLDVNGNFVWAKQLGGTLDDLGTSIAIDALGNVYTTGYFQGTADFDPAAVTFTFASSGSNDIFVSKLDATGNFVWAKQIGGVADNICKGIALDALGNVYTTGYFQGAADFDPGIGTFTLATLAGSYDICITKLDIAGNFVWAKQLGGTSTDLGHDIALDASGNVYTTGYFQGTADFDPSAGTFTLIASSDDIFVSKLDVNGNFLWAKKMGGSGYDSGLGIKLDASANVYTTGTFQSTADFDPGLGTLSLTPAGGYDTFVSKLDAFGNFVWAVNMGGFQNEQGFDITLDLSNNVYTTGFYMGTADFDHSLGVLNLTGIGGFDVFVHKMSQSSVGIKENVFVNSNIIYPNPFNNKLTIVSIDLKATSQIFNILGELVWESKIENEKTEIDLSNQASGIYFIRIGSVTKKVIKE